MMLFCHPMGAARYLIFGFEELARREQVRVVIIDRYVLYFLVSSTDIFFICGRIVLRGRVGR